MPKKKAPNPTPKPPAPPLSPLEQDVLRLSAAEITIRDGNGTRRITKRDAVLQKTMETALKGSPHAQRHYLDLERAAQAARQAEIDEEIEVWTMYCALKRAELDRADRAGAPEPEILPHPDDIEIDRSKGVTFKGPILEAELKEIQRACATRDALLLQDALQKFQDKCRKDASIAIGDPAFLAFANNRYLPRRFQIDEDEIIGRRMHHASIPGRDLIKQTRAAWKDAGVRHAPRGARLPKPETVAILFDGIVDVVKDWAETGCDPSSANEIVDARITQMADRLGVKWM